MGMGNDGGVIAAKRYLIKEKTEDRGARDKERRVQGFRWATCAMSAAPLREPVMADTLGNLFNKEAVLQYLLDKREIPAFAHIRSLKRDLVTLKLTRAPVEAGSATGSSEQQSTAFVCPITLIEANGAHPFVAMRRCGCVLSEKAVRELATERCPCCDMAFRNEDVLKLCPTEEETAVIRSALEARSMGARSTGGGSREAALAPSIREGAGSTTAPDSAVSGSKRKAAASTVVEGSVVSADPHRPSPAGPGAGSAILADHDSHPPMVKRRRTSDAAASAGDRCIADAVDSIGNAAVRRVGESQRWHQSAASSGCSLVGAHRKEEHSLAALAAAEASRAFEQQRTKSAVFAQLFKSGGVALAAAASEAGAGGSGSGANLSRKNIGPGGW